MDRRSADQVCRMTADRSWRCDSNDERTLFRSEEWRDTFTLLLGRASARGGGEMILSTSKIEDFDRFWNAFSTKGAEKRKQYGSKGAQVFRDPTDANRIWVVFDWDEEGYKNFVSDPDMAAIFQEAGLQGKPERAEHVGQHDA